MSDRDAAPPELDPTVTNIQGGTGLAVDSVVAGRYRILEMLGIGGMGMVYRALDEELDLEVALKVLRPELSNDSKLLERFRRELVLARQVTHKHVVRIHDIGKDDELVFLTMDFVRGQSLRQHLSDSGAMPAEEAAALTAQLARALGAAHERGVIHRDLKPSNIMVDSSGDASVTDFGVARSMSSGGMTRTGFIVGTPEYLSPEQVRGEDLDGRADLYALGVVLYELLTGDRPIGRGSVDETLAQHLQGVPSRLGALPKKVPGNLRAILKRALEPDRRRRYQTAAEMAEDLENLTRPARQLPSKRVLTGVGAALAAAAVLVAGILLWRQNRVGSAPASEAETATTLVILPFADETERADLAWLGAGLPELLFESLIRQSGIRVVNPQRVNQVVRDLKLEPGAFTEATLELAAELFDSSRLLTGSVRANPGGGIRIDAQLVNPATGLAAPVFLHAEAPAGAELATRAVERLEGALLDSLELGTPTAGSGLSSPALPEYTRAVQLMGAGNPGEAAEILDQALTRDSDFGAGWLRLSQAYEAMGHYDRARDAADRAVTALETRGNGLDRFQLLAKAQQARLSGEPGEAQAMLEELVKAYPSDVESAVELADAYGGEGRYGDALALLGQVVEAAPANADAWYLRAKYSILSGQSRIAVDEYLVRAMVLQNRLKNRQGQADVLNAFGIAYRELGEIGQAEESYQRAADIRKNIGDERGYAASLHNLAQIAVYRGDFEAAERDLKAAMEVFEKLGDEAGIADFYNELGIMEESRSDYRAALANYRSSLQIRRELGDLRAVGESLNNIGFANHQLGNYDDASVYWQQALDLYLEAQNVEGQTTVRLSLGQLHTTRGDWKDAQRTLLEALNGARELGWEPAMAAAQGALGRVAHFQGRYAAALAYYEDALERFEELDDERGTIEFSLARADALLELGAWDQVLEKLDALEEPLAAVGNDDQRADVLRLRGWARAGSGRLDEQMLAEAERLAAESANRALQLRIRLSSLAASESLSELEELVRSASTLGDQRLELLAQLELARVQAAEGKSGDAEQTLNRIDRAARRAGIWSHAHWVHLLRARLAADRPPAAEEHLRLQREELDRIGEGLSNHLVESLRQHAEEGELPHAA